MRSKEERAARHTTPQRTTKGSANHPHGEKIEQSGGKLWKKIFFNGAALYQELMAKKGSK